MLWWEPDQWLLCRGAGREDGQNPCFCSSRRQVTLRWLLSSQDTARAGRIGGRRPEPRLPVPPVRRQQAPALLLRHTVGNLEPKTSASHSSTRGQRPRSPAMPQSHPRTATADDMAKVGLGGLSVRKLSSGPLGASTNSSSTPSRTNEVSQMGPSSATTAWRTPSRKATSFCRLEAASADAIRLYRPGNSTHQPGAQADRMFYNALGQKENILYAKKAPTLDYAKWVARLQGRRR